MTPRAVLDRFFVERLRSEHSRRGYRDDWRKFCDWLHARRVAVLAAAPMDVRDYILGLERAGKGVAVRRRSLSVIRAIYGALTVEGLVAHNPAREVRNPHSTILSESL